MKHTKIIAAGLTAAIVMTGASAVFAEDSTAAETVTAASENMEKAETVSVSDAESGIGGDIEEIKENGTEPIGRRAFRPQFAEIDMSGLDLPEDFIPFDEAHVPDGIHVPKNGELKPIGFDEEGNMIYGQRPDGEMPPMNGGRSEFRNGERPDFEDGDRPELPEGEQPEFTEGESPELPELTDGERPEFNGGGMSGLPQGGTMDFGGQAPQSTPEFGGQGAQMEQGFGQAPQMGQMSGQPSAR